MSKAGDNARRKRRMERRKKRRESMRPHYILDLNKYRDDHMAAANVIEHLIDRRRFTPTAVMGVRLVEELERGEIDLLMEHYGWVADRIRSMLPSPDDKSFIKGIVDELELRGMVFKNEAPALVATGLKPIPTAKSLPMPTFDDDDEFDTLVLKRDTTTDASANFLAAALALQ